MKLWIKGLYIQILKFSVDRKIDHIHITKNVKSMWFITTSKKTKKNLNVQEFINNQHLNVKTMKADVYLPWRQIQKLLAAETTNKLGKK